MKTYMASSQTVQREWFIVDATGMALGRLATQVAAVLRGKNKPIFTPNCDCGDYVIVINADKIKLTGKKWDQKIYYHHSDYNGGLTATVAKDQMKKFPTRMVEEAIKGMLPHTKLGDQCFRHLFVYAGSDYAQKAQQPKELKVIK